MKYLLVVLLLLLNIGCGRRTKAVTDLEEPAPVTYVSAEPHEAVDDEPEEEYPYDFILFEYDNPGKIRVWEDKESAPSRVLDLIVISKEEYYSYTASGGFVMDTKLVGEGDSTFTISVAGEELCFLKEVNFDYGNRGGERWSEYAGYLPGPGLHGIRSCYVSGDLHGFADFFLVDENTGIVYYVDGEGYAIDYDSSIPNASPDNRYIAMSGEIYDPEMYYRWAVKILEVCEECDSENRIRYYGVTKGVDGALDVPVWINDRELVVREGAYIQDGILMEPSAYYKLSLGYTAKE